MPVYEDEYLIKDIQLFETWLAISRDRFKNCEESSEAYRKNAGVELISSILYFFEDRCVFVYQPSDNSWYYIYNNESAY